MASGLGWDWTRLDWTVEDGAEEGTATCDRQNVVCRVAAGEQDRQTGANSRSRRWRYVPAIGNGVGRLRLRLGRGKASLDPTMVQGLGVEQCVRRCPLSAVRSA